VAILPLMWRHSDIIAPATVAAITSFLDLTLSSPKGLRLANRTGQTQFELYTLDSTAALDNVLTEATRFQEFMQSVHMAPPQWIWK
jgi:hypothetical protein